MELHLLSLPEPCGESAPNVEIIYRICDSILESTERPQIIYIPDADRDNRFGRFTKEHFSTLGEVIIASTDEVPLAELAARLSDDALFYLPGGDPYRLAHKLHISGYLGFVRKQVAGGFPYVGFSAGAIMAGATTQTSNIENEGYSNVETLSVLPYGVNPHFPTRTHERRKRIEHLLRVSKSDDTVILAIEDDAHMVYNGQKVIAERPGMWLVDGRGGSKTAEPIVALNVG